MVTGFSLAVPVRGQASGGQGSQKAHGGGADGFEFFDVAGPGAGVGIGVGDELILIESGERGLTTTADPQGAVREDSLSVVDVA